VNVIPAPFSVESIDGEPFLLSAATPVVAVPGLEPLAEWFAAELAASTGIVIDLAEPGDDPAIRLSLVAVDPGLANLPATGGTRADGGDRDTERYALTIGADGIELRALAPEGIFRGLATLVQIAATAAAHGTAIALPPLSILDAPRFAWRGFSFDIVRTAFTVDEVKRVIDLLALYKVNVLHLHLTDSEGWRIEIDAWPRLAEVGGQTAAQGRPGLFYSKADYREIVRYATDRFITIVPEIEMPGHTAAIFSAYPELAGDGADPSTANLEQAAYFQAMHPDHPRIFGFIEDVLTEVAALTPGAWLHIGGDEALGMDEELYRRFVARVKPIVAGLGKSFVGWQETARAGLAPGDVAHLWISPGQGNIDDIDLDDLPEGFELPPEGSEVLNAFAEFLKVAEGDLDLALGQGASILVSQQSRSYLDTKYREPSTDPAQAADQRRLGMPFYPKSTVEEFYSWDPTTIRPTLTEERVAGVEGAIWCETVTSLDDIFFLLLPRLPGIAEKGWSPAVTEEAAAWAGYAPRISAHPAIWERRGWRYFRAQSVWEA
jgi:hexosaminidase